MTTNGPKSFAQPPKIRSSILDDVVMRGDFRFVREQLPGMGVHHFSLGNGGVGIQTPLEGADRSINPERFAWSFEQQVYREDEVLLIDRLSSSGAGVFYVPYDLVTESFPLASGSNTFRLARHEAGVVAGFIGSPTYSHKAWIDGAEQTVVSVAPASGEVQISGNSVSVVGATAATTLEVRYYPAYTVFAAAGSWAFSDYQEQSREVRLIEAGGT